MDLQTNFEIEDDNYYFCYVDNNSKLSKISLEHLEISSFESNIRRFYIVGNNLLNSLLLIDSFITGPNKYGYEVKITVNNLNPIEEDFLYSKVNKIITELHFDNAVPIDILLKSFNNSEQNCKLNLKISIIK